MGTTEKVARFITQFEFQAIPTKGVEQIKASMIDAIGTALLACNGPVGTTMMSFLKEMGGNPQARLIGSGMKTSVLNAALANGALIHTLDYDDGGGFGHVGAVLTPPALVLGEYSRLSGKRILEAYAVGFEIGTKLRQSMGEVQTEAGFHSTSLFGALCAAAESAKLLGLDVTQTRMALGMAASFASGIMQNFGTYTKPLHAGHAAQSGVMAAMLARMGLTADPDILEGPRGFFYVFGQTQSVIKHMTENIGKPLAIAEHDMHFKPWPCCGGNHEALTAMLRMVKQHDIKPDQVESIEVATSWKPPGPVTRTDPQNGYQGKFSLQYTMATAILDRQVVLDSFTDEKFSRPMLQNLIKKVKLFWHPDCAGRPLRLQSEGRFVVVTLKLNDGRVLSERQDSGTKKNLKGEEVYTKYRENAKIAGLGDSDIEHSVTLIKKLEDLEDMTELMDTVTRCRLSSTE
ncbi:MmgE/PrpD family protein [Chloroflexota bacterium]